MKTRRLICPKCGNIDKFNVDVELQVVGALLEFNGETAELEVSIPDDCIVSSEMCGVCGVDLRTVWHDATPNVMCPHCKFYVEGDLVEHCPYGNKKNSPTDYPACFKWKEDEHVELELI